MVDDQKRKFEEYFPSFTDEESGKAPGEFVSITGRRGVPDVFVMRLATEKSFVGPMILNRLTATRLKELLEQEGF